MKAYIYIGIQPDGTRIIFSCMDEPDQQSHGHRFRACIGPFQTYRAAVFMRDHGQNNPHCRSVADAERLAKLYAPVSVPPVGLANRL